MNVPRLGVLALAGFTFACAPLSAQSGPSVPSADHRNDAGRSPVWAGADVDRPWPLLAAGGAAGGAVGFGGTLYLTVAALDGCQGGGCAIPLAILPAAGALVGVPAGVHLANGRQGDFMETLSVSLLSALAGGLAVAGLDRTFGGGEGGEPAFLLAIPVTQIAGTVWWEKAGRGWHARRTGG